MKKLLVIPLLFLSTIAFAQLTFQLTGITNKKIESIPSGSNLELNFIYKDNAENMLANVNVNGKDENIDLKKLEYVTFKISNINEFWQVQALKSGAYENILKSGLQYKARNELDEEIIEYTNSLRKNNLIFYDSYLESYLYSIAYRIYPEKLSDGRPGIVSLVIVKDIIPNASIASNGTLFVTTGLLSTINSEAELIAVLAHEISHFVLDHNIININKSIQRQKRAEFWATLATTVAAIADSYIASNNDYYSPGLLTMSTAILSYSIAESINERLGLKFSKEQELDADKYAVELMKYIKTNPLALSSALEKIKKYCINTGNYLALSGEGTHPSLDERISKIGVPIKFEDKKYDVYISLVNSSNAILEFNKHHFSDCYNLASRNVNAKVGTEDDYLLMALVNINTYDTQEKNLESLEYIAKAKSLNVCPTINLSKVEAIIYLRLKKKNEALESLSKYRETLEKETSNHDKILNTNEWSAKNNFLSTEMEWTLKMINKVNNM
jgi:Zn-dependent protease with chaperone function